MRLKREFNRIGNLLNGGAAKTQHQAGHWAEEGVKQAAHISKRLRKQVATGTREAATIEEALITHVRENPALYILAGAVLIGALIAKVLFEARRYPEPPLL